MAVFCYALLTIFFGIFCYQVGKKDSFIPSAITQSNPATTMEDDKQYSLLPDFDPDLELERSRYKNNKISANSELKSSQYSSFKDTRVHSPPTPFSPPPIQIMNSSAIFTITSPNGENDSLGSSGEENV